MERGITYHRKMRAKHIRRKKSITSRYWHADEYPYYPCDGMYSKGKIHCSCPLCKAKTNNKKMKWTNGHKSANNWKHSDLQKIQLLHDQVVDLYAAVVELVDSPA